MNKNDLKNDLKGRNAEQQKVIKYFYGVGGCFSKGLKDKEFEAMVMNRVRGKRINPLLIKNKIMRGNGKNKSTDNKQKQILDIMVHDLRTPLNAVVGFSGLAKEVAQKYHDKKLDQFLKIVEQQALLTAKLMASFVQWHSETDKKEKINIAQIFSEIIAEQENMARENQVEIIVTEGLELKICANKNLIKTLLRNIVGNAVKHMPQRGEVRMKATKHNGELIITVTDNGAGIPPEKVKRIFEQPEAVNWTNIETGMGIGLYLCKKNIECEGGRIWTESIPGKGTAFHFTIPIHE